MKRLVVFSVFFAVFSMVADAAVTSQRRGQSVVSSSESGTSAAAPASSARSARSATPTASAPKAVSARSGSTPVSAAPVKPAAVSARAASNQKVIGSGTKIATAATNVLVDESCQKQFQGCMDSFCMIDNDNGGRCSCSDRKAELDTVLTEIEKLDAQSYKMATEGVERLEMGDSAAAILAKAKQTANEIGTSDEKKTTRKSLDLSLWDNTNTFSDEETNVFATDGAEDITKKTGNDLYKAAAEICVAKMGGCSKDVDMLKLMYGQNVKSDCAAYENELKTRKNSSASKLAAAEKALRDTALTAYQNANKYDLGQCTTEFKKCMVDTGGCKNDFTGCVGLAAADNATAAVGASKKVAKQYNVKGKYTKIAIAASTMDTLLAKKPLCESVTNSCTNVKDKVWDTFLADIAPTLKSAELLAESDLRTNCISNISTCIQKACRDTIDPNDPDGSMDMCLANPSTVRSLCKVQIDPCESAEPQIMSFVNSRLASMRVDACTTEVKTRLQSENVCGEDYSNCIGLDYNAINKMIHTDTLVACQENGQKKSMDDINEIIQGVLLNLDNELLNACQTAVETKVAEVCGDIVSCAAFDGDENFGKGSLFLDQSSSGMIKITGLIDLSKLTIAEDGTIAIDKYDDKLLFASASNAELNKIKTKIEEVINSIKNDPKVSQCISGRDMSQIDKTVRNKTSSKTTEARFPNLMDGYDAAIFRSAKEAAEKNYNTTFNAMKKTVMEKIQEKVASSANDICIDPATLSSK